MTRISRKQVRDNKPFFFFLTQLVQGHTHTHTVQVLLYYHHILSSTLMLLQFDSAAGQGDRINGWSFGAAVTVGHHTKVGVLALPKR